MSLIIKTRCGEGAFWGTLKALARQVLRFHLPVGAVTKPLLGALYGVHVFLCEGLIWALRLWWYEPLFRSLCVAMGAGFQREHLPYVVGRWQLSLRKPDVSGWGRSEPSARRAPHDRMEILLIHAKASVTLFARKDEHVP
jgi:hypothetical protein